MPKDDPCARALSRSLTVFVLQLLLAAAFVLFSLWIGSLALEWLNLVGISTVPPGIRYHGQRRRRIEEAEGRRMSEVSEDGLTAIVVVSIVLVLALVFCGFTYCVIRCFAPENTQGPAWNINSAGKTWVRGVNGEDKHGAVVSELSRRSYPNGVPIFDPQNERTKDPTVYMKPRNYDDKNNLEFAKERLVVVQKGGV